MRRWMKVVFAAAVLPLLAAGPVWAQDDDLEDYERTANNYGLGLGVGLVDPEGEVEPYLSVGFRIRLGGHGRTYEDLERGGMQAFIEPELGYWEHDSGNNDLLVGVNLLGVTALRRVSYSWGVGAGIHFVDFARLDPVTQTTLSGSDELIGLNAQLGLDVPVSDSLALFGVSRFDIVEGSTDDIQEKVYLGLRFGF